MAIMLNKRIEGSAQTNQSVNRQRIYTNDGNPALIKLLDRDCRRVLDIGCGAGDGAALVKRWSPECRVFGITRTPREATLAMAHMEQCWVFDIESELPAELAGQSFDALIFSHVLEHLIEPGAALARLADLLRPGGQFLIAVPNVVFWRRRVKFLLGRFDYEATGVGQDDTHLRFFTYFTSDRHLLSLAPQLRIRFKGVAGSVPLWCLRRHVLPRAWCDRIDAWGSLRWPNLFGNQILIEGIKG